MTQIDYNKFWSPAFDDMKDFVFLIDQDFNLIRTNKCFVKFVGKNESELVGKKCYSVVHNAAKPPPECPHQKVLKTKVFESNEFFDPSLKKWLYVTVTPIFDEGKNCIGSIHIVADVTKRMEEEREIRIKDEAMERAITAIAITGLDGVLTYANPHCIKLWGYNKKSDVLGRSIEDFWYDRKKRSAVLKILMEKGNWAGELVARRKDGSDFTALVSASVVTGKDGKPMCLMASFSDITENKRTEEELNNNSQRYKALFESNLDGILITDIETKKFTYANPAICTLLGYTVAELVKMGIADIHPKNSLGLVDELFKKFVSGKQGPPEDLPCLKKNGQAIHMNVSGRMITIKGKEYAIGFFRDITRRKEAEAALQGSEARYKALFAGTAEGIIIADLKTKRIRYANPASYRMFGYTERDFVKLGVADIHPKESLDHVMNEFKAQATGKKALAPELPCIRKDGTLFYADVCAAPIVLDGNECNVGFFTDITERKRMEEALKEEREKFRTVVESAQDAIFIKDKKGRYVMMNPAGAKLFGMRPQDIHGKTDADLFGSKVGRDIKEIDKKVMRGKTPYSYEKERIYKGVKRFFHTVKVPYLSSTGETLGLIGISRDLTEERRSAKIVKFYREYAENIVGNLPLSLLIVNRDLRINFANQHFLLRMHLTREDVTEKELAKVMGSSIVESSNLNEKIMQIIKRETERVEGRFALKGRTFDYLIVPLKEQTGKRLNAMLIMEDVTKNVAMEEQLIHSEKLSAVGTFTASVAHEINNPLSIVVGNIQYLLSNVQNMNIPDKKEVEELVETLTNANTEARRCAEIVTNLLHFSHKGKSEKTKISINSVVVRTMKLLEHQLELARVQTVMKLADDLPPVMGSSDHLQQAFVNLILNAEQVMKDGGKLYITTAADDSFVSISFRDTGPGIPKKYIRKIFEPFYSTKEAGKGTGLGLFIIHSIVEEHGGQIEVQSKRGQGANFILKLPVAKKSGWFA